MSEDDTKSEETTQEAEPTKKASVSTLENMDSEAIADAFASKFGDLGDFGPEGIDDLARQSAYRISVGGSQEFSSEWGGDVFDCRVDLKDALLTALSHGQNTSQSLGRSYLIVQGQMRIEADIYAMFNDSYVSINHIFYTLFKKFLNPEKVGDWNYDTFVQFCKKAGFPIESNYMFNFELLGAHGPAIEKYMQVFVECGAMNIDRSNKPAFIKETFEFPTRNLGLAVTNLEIGGSDPSESRNYGKTYMEDEEEKVYDNPTFIDPFHAQMGNFHRFMTHWKASVELKRQAAEAGEAESALLEKSKQQRQMATSFLNNFGGVHRGAQPSTEDPEKLIVAPQYYQNRVRCGRFGVKTHEDQVIEMNFWQPDSSTAGVAVVAGEVTAGDSTSEDREIEELAEQTF